jgi:hypothetical protein
MNITIEEMPEHTERFLKELNDTIDYQFKLVSGSIKSKSLWANAEMENKNFVVNWQTDRAFDDIKKLAGIV